MSNVTPASWAKTMAEVREYFEKLRQETFVFSTCGLQDGLHPKNNLYMWGHYGNGHKGIAIEFDAKVVAQTLVESFKKDTSYNYQRAWMKVNYCERLAPLTCEDFAELLAGNRDRIAQHLDAIPRTKGVVWERENEWRLMWRNTETRLKFHRCVIPVNAITGVFLGLNVSKQVVADCVFECSRNAPSASILQAHRRKGEFALEFKPLT